MPTLSAGGNAQSMGTRTDGQVVLHLGGHWQPTSVFQADTNSDRLFTVNDVKIGGSKYGIINLQGLKTPTFKVRMHENLYFTNRKVYCSALEPTLPLGQGPCSSRPNSERREELCEEGRAQDLIFQRDKWIVSS
jgi:hypothetical protein